MPTWNNSPEKKPMKALKATKEQAELLREKIRIEEEIKKSPDSELTKQFYEQWAKPLPKTRIEKEPEIPP